MSHNEVILLLGTNLGDKNLNIQTAEELIGKRIGAIIKKSEIIETAPIGFNSEHNFFNQTLFIQTILSPISLLKEIKIIENEMGRIYLKKNQEKYEDRTIDIDILTYNQLFFECRILKIPHHQIDSRDFVKNLLRF